NEGPEGGQDQPSLSARKLSEQAEPEIEEQHDPAQSGTEKVGKGCPSDSSGLDSNGGRPHIQQEKRGRTKSRHQPHQRSKELVPGEETGGLEIGGEYAPGGIAIEDDPDSTQETGDLRISAPWPCAR